MSIRVSDLSTQCPPNSVVIVYDIEGIGDVNNPSECLIWNLSAMVLGHPNNSFDQYIDPMCAVIPEPPNPKLFRVTRTFLKEANAQPCAAVLTYFFKWITNNYIASDGIVVLVSHGNFRYDQPLLQAEMLRNRVRSPPNLYFLDTLHWFRSILKGRLSYSLSSLYRNQFEKPIRNAHLALYDVHALHDLIIAQSEPLHGIMYKCYSTPLLRIPSVGLFTEQTLFNGHIDSIEQLIFKFINECQRNPNKLRQNLIEMNVRPCIAEKISTYVTTMVW